MPVDQLTNLPDRHDLQALLAALSAPTSSSQWPVSALLIDLDRFMELNTELGFEAGDRCLQELSALFASEVPVGSTVGRIGGDEFLVVLPSTVLDLAATIAQSLLAAVCRLKAVSATPLVTVSIGVATTPADAGWTPQQLLHLAEQRLVVAKKRLKPSRNCFWAARLPAGWLSEAQSAWPSHPGEPHTEAAP